MKVKVTRDHLSEVLASIRTLAKTDVLVGVPADGSDKQGSGPIGSNARPDAPITNAEIGYLNEFGSPAQNLPARPHLVPGVRAAQERIAGALGWGAKDALKGVPDGAVKSLHRAGLLAQMAVRTELTTGAFVPLSPKTIEQRYRQSGTKKRRKNEKKYLDAVASGVSPAQAQTEAGIKPLINTGGYRNSIAYVIRPRGK